MSNPTPPSSIIKKRRILAIATETTPGTPIVATSLTPIYCIDPMPQASIAQSDRDATGTIGQLIKVPGTRTGKLGFKLEVAGGGTQALPTWASILLSACGMSATSNTYKPTSSVANFTTCTLAVFENGPSGALVKTISGAMGTAKISGENGKVGTFDFDFTGIWNPAVDGTMPSIPLPAVTPPKFSQAAFSLTPAGGSAFTPKISKFEIDLGNTITLVPDITQASGFSYAIVTARKVTGSMDPQSQNVAAWDPFGQMIAGTTSALSLVLGSNANNTLTITAPNVQIVDDQEADRDQLVIENQKLAFAINTGDDEISLAWS